MLYEGDDARGCLHGGGGRYPPRLTGKVRNQAASTSPFWSKADASFRWRDKGAVVQRARHLARVMGDAGVEVRELQTSDPGQVVWEDARRLGLG